jgi:hypothetical protein
VRSSSGYWGSPDNNTGVEGCTSKKKRRRHLRLVFDQDRRPQTMTRQAALRTSLLFIHVWPAYEVRDVRYDHQADRLLMRHRPTGEVATFTA